MRALFPHRLYTQRLFCRRCQKVREHGIFARENYSTYGGMDSHIPLLCSCDRCQTLFIAFSHEFNFCRPDLVNRDYAKIYGHNRIVPGNWVYFKGTPKPGLVKSVFNGPEKEIVEISYDGNSYQKVECPKVSIENEESPDGYRLLPAQSAHTLLGDYVYHAIRDQFGIAVGLVNDGEKDKLAVWLKDRTLVFITLPGSHQNLSNDKLLAVVRWKLMQLFPQEMIKVNVEVGQGVVYLNGLVRNLSVKRALKDCVNGLPQVRGCVDNIRIQSDTYATDAQIEKAILGLFETSSSRYYDYSVDVSFGKVAVKACCSESSYNKDLENRIAEIPGILDLSFLVSVEPEDSAESIRQCRLLEMELSKNNLLHGALIRVAYTRKKFLLEGSVRSALQKQVALLTAVKCVRSPAIENRLRLI